MRVAFCWMTVSGYMTACWRALATRPGVELSVLALGGQARSAANTMFTPDVARGFPCTLVGDTEAHDPGWVARWVADRQPDVVVLCGWAMRGYRRLVGRPEFARTRFVLGMDNPWWGRPRQRLARVWVGGLLRRVDRVVVSGERSWQYAWRLGAPPARIRRGLYGVDFDRLAPALGRRLARPDGWPRAFLYVGRLDPEKGITDLVDGYSRYRRAVPDPWDLVVCGAGPLRDRIEKVPGVRYRGFVQPADMPAVWADAGAFVLASTYDPWPLVLVEASAAGLPVVHTDACGSGVEMVRQFYNGLTVAARDPGQLADGLGWVHRHPDRLAEFGRRSQRLAEAYSAEAWADRWLEWLGELTGE
jgi:glycosyltransferase involved in cell wall biosynthesis